MDKHELEIYKQKFAFECALNNKNIPAMLQSTGVLKYLGAENIDWLYYWICVTEGNYIQALKHLDACIQETGEYDLTFNREYAECYSNLGDFYNLAQVFIRMGSSLGIYEFVLFMSRVREKTTEKDFNSQYDQLVRDKIIPASKDYAFPAVLKENDEREEAIQCLVLQKIARYVSKAVDLKRKYLVGKYVNHSTYIPEEYVEFLHRAVFIVELLPLVNPKNKDLRERCLKVFAEVTEEDYKYQAFMYEATVIIEMLLFVENNNSKNYENYVCYLDCMMTIGHYWKMDKELRTGISALRKNAVTDPKIKDLIYKAYVYENAIDDIAPEIKEIAEDYGDENQFKDDIRVMRIELSCPMESTVALDAAEWYYRQVRSSSYGTLDAGLLSLSYFRIIELEYNIRFIKPLLASVSITDLRNFYTIDTGNRSKTQNKSYSNRWDRLLDTIERVKSPVEWKNGLTLGEIRHLIRNLRNSKRGKYCLEDYLYNAAVSVLKSDGIIAFHAGEMEDVISEKHIEKYRNPPAHTRYLAYDIACECREYVLRELEKMGKWFYVVDKETDIANGLL